MILNGFFVLSKCNPLDCVRRPKTVHFLFFMLGKKILAAENIETSPQVLPRRLEASVFVCKESETIPHRCNTVSAFRIFFDKRERRRHAIFFHFTFDGAHGSVFRNLYDVDFILLFIAPEKQIGSRSGVLKSYPRLKTTSHLEAKETPLFASFP